MAAQDEEEDGNEESPDSEMTEDMMGDWWQDRHLDKVDAGTRDE